MKWRYHSSDVSYVDQDLEFPAGAFCTGSHFTRVCLQALKKVTKLDVQNPRGHEIRTPALLGNKPIEKSLGMKLSATALNSIHTREREK